MFEFRKIDNELQKNVISTYVIQAPSNNKFFYVSTCEKNAK